MRIATAVALGVVACLSGLALAAPPSAPPLRRVRVIELPGVEGRIDHLAVDVQARRLYVAALGHDTVEVIDLAAGRHLRSLRGLAEPQGVLVRPDAQRLFVACGRDGSLRVFDTGTLAAVTSVALGSDADNVRSDPEGRVWVGYGEGALAAVDTSGRKLADVPLGGHPESFQVERSGPRIFVNVPDRHEIAVVDRNRATVVARWRTGTASANYPMALDEAGHRLFVVCRAPARLLAIDSDTGTITAQQATVGDADDVFSDAVSKRLYVSGGDGAIAVHARGEANDGREIVRLDTAKGARTSLFVPDLRRLFLAVRRQGDAPAAVWEYETAE